MPHRVLFETLSLLLTQCDVIKKHERQISNNFWPSLQVELEGQEELCPKKNLYQFKDQSIHLFVYYSSICLSIYPFVYLYIYLSIYTSICLSIHPFVYLFIHPFIDKVDDTFLTIDLSISLKANVAAWPAFTRRHGER